MIREAMDKVESLVLEAQDAKIVELYGRKYTANGGKLSLVALPKDMPSCKKVYSLDGLIDIIKMEISKFSCTPLFVMLTDHLSVSVVSSLDEEMDRCEIYSLHGKDVPGFSDTWFELEQAMIALRSRFIPNEGTQYIIDLISRINDKESVKTNDNGVTQTVEVKKGVALSATEKINPRVSLRPFRTFFEVEQPESEFLLRVSDGGRVGLFEADGGMWKQAAKKSIADYLRQGLSEEIEKGLVVVSA